MPLTRRNRRRWLAYAATIFATGVLSGAFFGWGEAHRRRFPPGRPPGPASGQHLTDHLRAGLQAEFGLTDEQVRKVEPILERRAKALDAIFDRSRAELDTLSRASDDELAAVLGLSAEQKTRLPWLARRGPGGPGGPGERGRPGHEERERREFPERGERGEYGERGGRDRNSGRLPGEGRYPGERPPPR